MTIGFNPDPPRGGCHRGSISLPSLPSSLTTSYTFKFQVIVGIMDFRTNLIVVGLVPDGLHDLANANQGEFGNTENEEVGEFSISIQVKS